MVLGVAGGVIAVQAAAAAEIDGSGVLQGHDAVGGDGREHAEEMVERVAVDQPSASHEPARVGEMPCASLMDDDLSPRIQGRDVAGAAGVVEVDVRHHHGGEILGGDPELGQGVAYHRGRRRGPGLHQARPVAADQVSRRDPVVPRHPGIDLEHLMAQRRNVFVHRVIVADGRPQSAGPNVRRTSPVRGLGPNDVDLRGTRSPCAAIWMTASNEGGLQITAVAPVLVAARTASAAS